MDALHAERIGHGYNVVYDSEVYRYVREKGVHFEGCPISSYLTGAVKLDVPKHPIIR